MMFIGLSEKVIQWLTALGVNPDTAVFLKVLVFGVLVALLSFLANWLASKLIHWLEYRIIRHTKNTWDDFFVDHRVFVRLSHLAPALVIYFTSEVVFGEYTKFEAFIREATYIYMLFTVMFSIDAAINALHSIYNTLPVSHSRPIKGYLQLVKIFIYLAVVFVVISILFDVKVGKLFTGMGAFAAVLMLVFKDTILGFVSSLQISGNNMVKPGDWIEMPSRGADGTVIDISLYTVKVQNWDKTISTIPTYALVSESFQNWRGMEESGGRRIKRHISIDMKSVKFCTPEMLEKYKKIRLLKEYILQKQKELDEFNRKHGIDESVKVNGRRLTNLGTFRKYVEMYLRNHPMIHQEMTFLVRHRQPAETGLPLEIYVFSKDQRWAAYESIQADIFDHLLAVVPEFDLRVFQDPTGDDFRRIGTQEN